MFNISLQAEGNPTENLQKLITGLSANQSVLMGKISKEIAVRLQKKFLSNGGETFWKDASNSIYKHHTETTTNVVVKKVGVALQRYGGTVLPKRARRLAIFNAQSTLIDEKSLTRLNSEPRDFVIV